MQRFVRSTIVWSCCIKHFSTLCNGNLSISTELFSTESKLHFIKKMKKTNKTFSEKYLKHLKKQAGVLIPLCEVKGEPSILFTQRSVGLRSHKGQVSFPGGVADATDSSLIQTALRETEEEIGLSRDCIEVWTTTPMLPGQGMTVKVVGVVAHIGVVKVEELTPNFEEVASIFTVPIRFLVDSKNIRFTKFRLKQGKPGQWDYISPVYLTNPKIWGLTACFLDLVLQNLISFYKPVLKQYVF